MRRVNCELTFLLLLLWQGYCDFSLIHPVHVDDDDERIKFISSMLMITDSDSVEIVVFGDLCCLSGFLGGFGIVGI